MFLEIIKRKFRQSRLYGILLRLRRLHSEPRQRREYFEKIDAALGRKKVVIAVTYGGIGDVLIYSSLPRLLKEQKDTDFYFSESSRSVFRHPDIFKLCFGLNPYFKGFAPDKESVTIGGFIRQIDKATGPKNLLETLENQFELVGTGLPEIFYKPKKISSLENTLLIDTNTVSGAGLGWVMDESILKKIIDDASTQGKTIKYVDPKAQNIFEYVDMIYSANYFVCFLSGGHALAVALRKPCTVILPENFDGGGISKFIYPKWPLVTYVRKRSMSRYLDKK